MRFRLPLFAVIVMLFLNTALAGGPSVNAGGVWIRTAPAGVEVLSGYLTLENQTDKPLQITSMSSPDFDSVTIGTGAVQGKAHSTLLLTDLVLPPHKPVVFKQDGRYLHLLRPHKRLYEDDMVTLIFKFSDGSSLALMAPVRSKPPGN